MEILYKTQNKSNAEPVEIGYDKSFSFFIVKFSFPEMRKKTSTRTSQKMAPRSIAARACFQASGGGHVTPWKIFGNTQVFTDRT